MRESNNTSTYIAPYVEVLYVTNQSVICTSSEWSGDFNIDPFDEYNL